MIKAGVIGHPISHSKSPIIHGYWLSHYAIEGEYKAYDIPPAQLKDGIQELVDGGLSGFNVTLPHKQNIMNFCNSITEAAQKIGAVNTVVIDGHGKIHGDNTDAFGFTENLQDSIPDFEWAGKKALVIGAGGAARAVVYALKSKGLADILIANRTEETAKELATAYDVQVLPWESMQTVIGSTDMIVNTTSLGMVGQPPLQISLSGIASNTIVYDIVYNPLMTPFLQEAKQNGANIITGIGMLLHQARPAFRAWFGTYPDVTDELMKII